MKNVLTFTVAAVAAGLFIGVSARAADPPTKANAKQAAAIIHGAGAHKDKIKGDVTFTEVSDGVKIVAHVDGLTPGKHGFHIHEKTDLSKPDLTSAGPHFNPEGHKHGGPDSESHHAGDLGNLEADEHGHADYEMTVKDLTIQGSKNSVVGHSVIIHEKEDDLKTDPAGAAGARIAGGAIQVKSSTGRGVQEGK